MSGFAKPVKVIIAFVSVCLNWLWVVCYSYPLFSFQGSTRFCSGRRLFYQIFILLSSIFLNFFKFFFELVWLFLTSENYYIRSDSACQCFSFETSAVNLADILFFAPFRQAHFIIIHALRRMSTLFSTFFTLFWHRLFSFPKQPPCHLHAAHQFFRQVDPRPICKAHIQIPFLIYI